MNRRKITALLVAMVALAALTWGVVPSLASSPKAAKKAVSNTVTIPPRHTHGHVTNTERKAAAARAAAIRAAAVKAGKSVKKAVLNPAATPDYFGTIPNFANSPLPVGPIGSIMLMDGGRGYGKSVKVAITDISWGSGHGAKAKAKVVRGHIVSISVTKPGRSYTDPVVTITGKGTGAEAMAVLNSAKLKGGIRKFVEALPGLGATGANALGQYIPVAVPDTTTFTGSDYYEIALVQYTEKLSPDLPATTLRGYVQLETAANASQSKHIALKYPDGSPILDATGAQVLAVDNPQYLGPTIVAQTNRPVRVKFTNYLPSGTAGDLFLPVDTTLMGAGLGPLGAAAGNYTQDRATLHLHGGATPWISDGTPYQWTTPAADTTSYKRGVSVAFVPDMWFDPVTHKVVASTSAGATNDPGPGSLDFYYTNQQSARLMFYHDHAVGLTRLNVYAGEAAPFLLTDKVEQDFIAGTNTSGANPSSAKVIPATEIPLVIQDKTFVPGLRQLTNEDPTWDVPHWGSTGSLWLPHVYMPNQNPFDSAGVNALGRWDYNSWFYPPQVGQTFGPVANPLFGTTPLEGPQNPGTPDSAGGGTHPTIVPESFMDTPLVNGAAYPFVKVQRKAYRFRILNASDDRMLNLQLYYATSNAPMWNANGTLNDANAGEVPMVAAAVGTGLPKSWPKDGRDGGVPNPKAAGPTMMQIGNEGGFLPAVAMLPNTPVGYEYFRRTITVLNVTNKTLMLGPAERADVIIDFSKVPAGAKLILYNDAPAPVPAFDSRLDYYTNDGSQTSSGGAPNTAAGFGPNTRTIMQFQVSGPASAPYNVAALKAALPKIFAADQPKPIVPEPAYNAAYSANFPLSYMRVLDPTLTFTPIGASAAVTIPMEEKAIIEQFDFNYGRMNAVLGTGLANGGVSQGTATPYSYDNAPTDFLLDSTNATQIGALGDGTQIWRVDHQGVDTHAIHFHLFNVEVINRVAIDGQIFPPDANELGWKETVRMNPGQDVILAVRATVPTLPWKLGESIRPLEPSVALGAQYMDANGTLNTNALQNYGWEYVWHCHLLGHEENDMMRPIVFQVAPAAPSALTQTAGTASVALAWTDNASPVTATLPAATMYTVQRATDVNFTQNVVTFPALAANATTFTDTTAVTGTPYFYRVRAENAPSFSVWVSSTSPATSVTPL